MHGLVLNFNSTSVLQCRTVQCISGWLSRRDLRELSLFVYKYTTAIIFISSIGSFSCGKISIFYLFWTPNLKYTVLSGSFCMIDAHACRTRKISEKHVISQYQSMYRSAVVVPCMDRTKRKFQKQTPYSVGLAN